MSNPRMTSVWWTLKLALGVVPLLAGVDKFFGVLANWADYLHPSALQIVPVPPDLLLRGIGVFEILVGIAILTRWTRFGAWLAALWFTAIAASLASMGRLLEVAVHDVVLALSCIALAQLTTLRREEEAPERFRDARGDLPRGDFLRLDL